MSIGDKIGHASVAKIAYSIPDVSDTHRYLIADTSLTAVLT